jgi:hypothetical protein
MGAHQTLGGSPPSSAALHVGHLLTVDQRVVEHIKLTTDWYGYAGILALLTLLLLTVPAAAAIRRRLWAQHRGFQAGHVAAACPLVVTLAIHVLTTDRYVHGRAHAVVYTLDHFRVPEPACSQGRHLGHHRVL